MFYCIIIKIIFKKNQGDFNYSRLSITIIFKLIHNTYNVINYKVYGTYIYFWENI